MKGILVFNNKKDKEIKRISLLKLPIKEDEIIKKSIKLYDDDEPCIIYRTTIINRIGLDLLLELERLNICDKILSIDKLNQLTKNILEIPKEVKSAKFI